MKNLLKNLWEAPAATMAGAINAAIAVVIAAELNVPDAWLIGIAAAGAFFGFISGPNNAT